MRDEDRIRVQHLIDSAESALHFVAGRSRSELDSNRMLLFAVIRAVEVMGEAASKLGESVRAEHPEIPWTAIVSMRNRLIHGYFDVDTEIVWKTVTMELPQLLPHLRALLHGDQG